MASFNSIQNLSNVQRMLFVSTSAVPTAATDAIAYSTSASISFSKDDIDISNKTDGNWAKSRAGKKSAELSVDALCAKSGVGKGETDLFAAWKAGTSLYFKYAYITVTEQADGSTNIAIDTTRPAYTGVLLVSSLDLSSDNGDVCKYSCSANSQGKVTRVAGSPAT